MVCGASDCPLAGKPRSSEGLLDAPHISCVDVRLCEWRLRYQWQGIVIAVVPLTCRLEALRLCGSADFRGRIVVSFGSVGQG
ncbi:hypothetical protein C8034_v008311 [Colletotrichum sidae]|uniref:Uncharacterized protein n=1 Tax=Colletotrichum sidae TaxID=1347389 RepID=A0A4R8TQS5_9PEZI|nr:hypothetical protein C8034_v008311 [Colletotrichum sidae]